MLVKLESQLKNIQAMLADNVPKERIPLKGTLAVIKGNFDFCKTDGYIQFIKLAFDNITNAYGKQKKSWQECLNQIYQTAEKLQDMYTRFTGNTKENFWAYCQKLSRRMDDDGKIELKTISLEIIQTDDMVSVLEKHIASGNKLGFYYEETEDIKKELMYELMEQLSHLKFEKTDRNTNISYFLRNSGCHEHVHDALNLIIGTAVYAINCSSTKNQDSHIFDRQTVHQNLEYAKTIMERVKQLV